MKRLLSVLMCALFLSVAMLPLNLLTAEAYGYQVRVYSGEQGMIDGKEMVSFNNLDESYRIDFSDDGTLVLYANNVATETYKATVNNGSKYYIIGLREAGKDNRESIPYEDKGKIQTFLVRRDMDYVIAYGMSVNSVGYTVRYVDTNGASLREDQSFYGKVGDRPALAYQYIEGYLPQINIVDTLKGKAEENVYNFVYTSTKSS